MASEKVRLTSKPRNKLRRQALHVKRKRAQDSSRRDERFRRKREEDKHPELREDRLKRNVPLTLDRKRVWDEVEGEVGDGIGLSVDAERLKRWRTERQSDGDEEDRSPSSGSSESDSPSEDDDLDSMIDFGSDDENQADDTTIPSAKPPKPNAKRDPTDRATSPTGSTTTTKLDQTPDSLASKFPTLFAADSRPTPKILITTSINSTLHHQAELLTTLFPHSVYIRRSAHRYGHKFSIREISSFATARNYTTLIVLKEDQKKPTGLTIVHLPHGPTFHLSISNWVEGKKLPGHGNATNHIPELILNNFRTPLGLLTAHLFQTLFPRSPDLVGRQVVTLHNQRDYIFLRRHRYIFREKRVTEKSVVGTDGKEVKGVEGIRTGLQELGPRFTMKLRRVDKGIQRGGDGVEWEWKGGMEKQRTKFQL
ncbi:MAG: hypothetical protein M1835_008213 [Candelina submexicana]|nr:MAG: hypothetical protein M1835_008213 [Candelina submexicana]